MNELQNLSQIFQNKVFRIPDYQRGYGWQDTQLRDFWEDAINSSQIDITTPAAFPKGVKQN